MRYLEGGLRLDELIFRRGGVQVTPEIQGLSIKANERRMKATDSAYNQGAVHQVLLPCFSRAASSRLNSSTEGSPSSTMGLPEEQEF